MLKHGLLHSRAECDRLLGFDLKAVKSDELLDLLHTSVDVKAEIVRQDPHEKGLRKSLNLGHTVGHAFESHALAHKRELPHGYAVACGLVAELVLSHIKLDFPSEYIYRIANYVSANYGSYHITCDDYGELLALMRHDKKSERGEINCTLLSQPGIVALNQLVADDEMKEALDLYRDLLKI